MNVNDIIVKPIITEKSMNGLAEKRYTFKVANKANKIDIKHAVEELFSVNVKSVKTLHVLGKKRRQGKTEGYTPAWKKAYVTLTASSKEIEFFEGMY